VAVAGNTLKARDLRHDVQFAGAGVPLAQEGGQATAVRILTTGGNRVIVSVTRSDGTTSARRGHCGYPMDVPSRMRQSDSVRTVTAAEAHRSFAALLDEVEQGQTVIVTRGGRRIAKIEPIASGNGTEVLALLEAPDVDDGFGTDVLAARECVNSAPAAWRED